MEAAGPVTWIERGSIPSQMGHPSTDTIETRMDSLGLFLSMRHFLGTGEYIGIW